MSRRKAGAGLKKILFPAVGGVMQTAKIPIVKVNVE
jgi:hypothetical protein